jgi:hypothetical protein
VDWILTNPSGLWLKVSRTTPKDDASRGLPGAGRTARRSCWYLAH